jgi:type I restriction enzyme M protein
VNHQELSSFIWQVADLLRGDYKPHEYGQVILPFTVLRRLDCVLADTKTAVLKKMAERKGKELPPGPVLERAARQKFYNTSRLLHRT